MKRVLAFALTLGLAGFVVGCGGGSSSKNNEPGPAPKVGGKEVPQLKAPVQPKSAD